MAHKNPNKILLAGVLLGGAVLLGPASAYADKYSGFYIGGGGGQSRYLDLSDICNNQIPGGVTTTCDNKGLAWKAFGGYQFIRYFGVEVGYYDFGKGNIKTPGGGQVDYKARGPYLGAVVTVPVFEHISLLARAGAIRWSTKLNPDGTAGFTGVSDNGINASFGLGVEYMFNTAFGVRAEWERFANIGDNATTGQTNIDLYSVSGLLRF